ncbi:MBL fold metallo-hydrolase [Natrialbaceae archaeon A-CW1-1]
MHVTFLGTGSAMPVADRHQTGILLETNDQVLLVDCGAGILHRLAATDVGYEGVGTVLLTHHHLDHVNDLLALLKARWLAGVDEFEVIGPAGTEALVHDLLSIHDYLQDRIDLTIREVGSHEFSIGAIDVDAYPTRHSMDCLAYRFSTEDAAGDFTFSGDSEAFADLAAFADGSSVLVHDCSFPDQTATPNHASPAELGEALTGTDIGCVYLTHLYPHVDGHRESMLESIGRQYDGEVRFAADGLSLEI